MQAKATRRGAKRGILVLAFGAAWMTGACGSPLDPVPLKSCPAPPDTPTDTATDCAAATPEPCMRYHLQLVGDLMNAALRASYITAFRDACYVSEAGTFDCWYKTWEKACEDAALIGEKSGNAPYDKGYTCQPDGVGNY